MAGETALPKIFRRKVTTETAVHLLERQYAVHMATFDTKITDFYQQFAGIDVQLRIMNARLEGVDRCLRNVESTLAALVNAKLQPVYPVGYTELDLHE